MMRKMRGIFSRFQADAKAHKLVTLIKNRFAREGLYCWK